MQHDPRILLADIDLAAKDIYQFIEGMDVNAYIFDLKTQAAVERKFEVIGEALNRLQKSNPSIAKRIPEMRSVIDFRNHLSHGYDSIYPDIVWFTAKDHLPKLHTIVNALLDELNGTEK